MFTQHTIDCLRKYLYKIDILIHIESRYMGCVGSVRYLVARNHNSVKSILAI